MVDVLDLVALCPDADTVIRMALGYVDEHNDAICQFSLASLMPSECHSHVTKGTCPRDSYFGVKASEPGPVREVAEDRLRRRLERSEKASKRAAPRRERRPSATAEDRTEMVRRDHNQLFR